MNIAQIYTDCSTFRKCDLNMSKFASCLSINETDLYITDFIKKRL